MDMGVGMGDTIEPEDPDSTEELQHRDGHGSGSFDLAALPKDRLALSRRRVIVLTGGAATAALIVGLIVAGRLTSPDEVAARTQPPPPSVITASVEQQVLTSEVVTRGDVVYEGAAGVVIETGGLQSAAIVTGALPKVGDSIAAGGVLMQVSGRPVLVLPGEVPVYRSLRPGMSGPDVVQLKTALAALGIDAGPASDQQYTRKTANAVAALYQRVGYTAPEAAQELREAVRAAQESVTSAEDRLFEAESTLSRARADADLARQNGEPVPSVAIEEAAVTRARKSLSTARTAHETAAFEAGTPLPASEVVFLPVLPRRIDAVNVRRGSTVGGEPVVQVSGTDLVVVATLRAVDVPLVTADMPVTIRAKDTELSGTVVTIRQPAGQAAATPDTTDPDAESGGGEGGGGGGGGGGASGARQAVIRLQELDPEQVAAISGANVQVRIPVETTDGEVLTVPMAALTAGAGGESRVTVAGADGETHLVEVEVGLVAEGRAQVTPVEGRLAAGDQVVVGR